MHVFKRLMGEIIAGRQDALFKKNDACMQTVMLISRVAAENML